VAAWALGAVARHKSKKAIFGWPFVYCPSETKWRNFWRSFEILLGLSHREDTLLHHRSKLFSGIFLCRGGVDFFWDGGHVFFVVGPAAGKGVPAGLWVVLCAFKAALPGAA